MVIVAAGFLTVHAKKDVDVLSVSLFFFLLMIVCRWSLDVLSLLRCYGHYVATMLCCYVALLLMLYLLL